MNIYPSEIENLLVKYPGIQQAAVIGLSDEKWGEIVGVVLMPNNAKNPPEPCQIYQFCRDNLAAHKAPVKWFFVSEYPLTPSGKIQKYKLVDLIASGQLLPVESF